MFNMLDMYQKINEPINTMKKEIEDIERYKKKL